MDIDVTLNSNFDLFDGEQVEVRCRGQQLSPLLTMQHVRDTIWIPKSSSSSSSSSPSFTLLRDSSTTDHIMILHYGRTALI
ncbi:hypothetical protein CARUB_v10012026mg [Capsella rubella]|uniref:Uncharacterized protein n=1 Tax=Capsella rubella TaxID=81985 RepID=R0IHG3_9BRAS|nr:hypothetical protein CARUB_v10012026mg [Capsella rubella]